MISHDIPGEGLLAERTTRNRRVALTRWWRFLETRGVHDEGAITHANINEFLVWVKQEFGIGGSTLHLHLKGVRVWLKRHRRDLLRDWSDMIDRPRFTQPTPRAFTEKQDVAVMYAAKHAGIGIFECVVLMRWQGLRVGEALALQWENIRPDDEGKIHIFVEPGPGFEPKNHRVRKIPLFRHAAVALMETRAWVKKWSIHIPYVVLAKARGQDYSKRVDFPAHAWAPMVRAAGLKYGAQFNHQLRRTFATRLAQKGVALPTIQRWMGHATLDQLERYLDVDQVVRAADIQLVDDNAALYAPLPYH